jgi:hypothetical protein
MWSMGPTVIYCGWISFGEKSLQERLPVSMFFQLRGPDGQQLRLDAIVVRKSPILFSTFENFRKHLKLVKFISLKP